MICYVAPDVEGRPLVGECRKCGAPLREHASVTSEVVQPGHAYAVDVSVAVPAPEHDGAAAAGVVEW